MDCEVKSNEEPKPLEPAVEPEVPEAVEEQIVESQQPGEPQPADEVIYEGGAQEEEEDVEFKVIFEEKIEQVEADGNDVDIEVRGVQYRIPHAIECHLCNEMMNLCLRRTRYRGQFRDYPAYRCNRKGCQTFRSIRKVFQNCVTETDGNSNSRMVYQPSPTRKSALHSRTFVPNDADNESSADNGEFVIQRVFLPKPEKDQFYKTASITERVRRANQARAAVFSEFADQLRRDIAANKRMRVKKQPNQDDDQQGTLFYISKELNPHEVVEVQDAILKTLLSLRKISSPMSMHDLPLFANCPYSKAHLESGLASPKHRELFWGAVTNSPQPPLPTGFIKRKDDTLIYRNPKPYVVPEILRENSPRKQVVDTLSYHQRKGVQDLKRIEKRHNDKKIRSWTSLKREFDMAETDDFPTGKIGRRASDSDNKYTLQEIISKMENTSQCRMSGTIRSRDDNNDDDNDNNDEHNGDAMLWIDDQVVPSDELKKTFESHECSDEQQMKKMHEVFKNLASPRGVGGGAPAIQPFPTHIGAASSASFVNDPFNSGHLHYTFGPYLNSYPMAPASIYQSRELVDEQYLSIGASEVVQTEPSLPPPSSQFTYIHPHSGVRLTDPSVYLTTFVPSPVAKAPPMCFSDVVTRCSTSEQQQQPPSSSNDYDTLSQDMADEDKPNLQNFTEK